MCCSGCGRLSTFVLPFLCCCRTNLFYRMLLCFCCLCCCSRLQFLFCCCDPCILHFCFAYSVERHRQCVGVCVCLLFHLLSFNFLVFASLSSLFRLMHHGKSPSTCLSFCLPPPFPVSLSCFLILVCFCVLLTTHSLLFFSAFEAHLTTAHSRCDVFLPAICPCNLQLLIRCLDTCGYLREPL